MNKAIRDTTLTTLAAVLFTLSGPALSIESNEKENPAKKDDVSKQVTATYTPLTSTDKKKVGKHWRVHRRSSEKYKHSLGRAKVNKKEGNEATEFGVYIAF